MHRSIRLVLPVTAAVAALVLTGCNDDEEAAFGMGDGGSSETPAEEEADGGTEVEDPAPPAEEEESEAPDAPGSDTAGTGDVPGEAPTAEQLEGDWQVGPDVLDPVFRFENGQAIFQEDTDIEGVNEGDVCYGPVINGHISFTCEQYGDEAWTDTEADVRMEAEDHLVVTWSSGLVQDYEPGRLADS
ncbi:hypothetical protein [Streptomyces sp. NPDC049881]|uniref:hypothetical protein n=1 Tax=unclassified Streptomyces TaxID=2593676 RepID=UPI00341F2448